MARSSAPMQFPRTMTRGKFAGQTFQTITEYQAALRLSGKTKRKPAGKRAKAASNGGPSAVRKQIKKKDEHAEFVTWAIGMYESYMDVGATPEDALAKTIEMTR